MPILRCKAYLHSWLIVFVPFEPQTSNFSCSFFIRYELEKFSVVCFTHTSEKWEPKVVNIFRIRRHSHKSSYMICIRKGLTSVLKYIHGMETCLNSYIWVEYYYVLDEGIQILILWPGQGFIENGMFFFDSSFQTILDIILPLKNLHEPMMVLSWRISMKFPTILSLKKVLV